MRSSNWAPLVASDEMIQMCDSLRRVKEAVTKDTLEMLESLADAAQDADDNHDDKKLFHIVKIIGEPRRRAVKGVRRRSAGWNEDV